ncbi:hypothetical protein VNI00_007682 [Paramarasmius palmivorus]|uniref:Anaphase-promoting complex subunit 2 n=1 Tax=Paramarasmius palmivorus TaxID=297713 RepID=A0AAW0D3B3_9AGAR
MSVHPRDIRTTLQDALSEFVSKTNPDSLQDSETLRRIFESWREALLDINAASTTPQILAYLLNEEYEGQGDAIFTSSSLRGKDRFVVSQLLPIAKAYAFDLHFASAEDYEEGYPVVVPRNKSVDKLEGMDISATREDDEYSDDDSIVELEEMDRNFDVRRGFRICNESNLDGFPMDMTGLNLEKATEGEFTSLLINGDLVSREPVFEFGDIIELDNIREAFLIRRQKCLLISSSTPRKIGFRFPWNLEDYARKFFGTCTSSVSPESYEAVIGLVLQWLRKQSQNTSFGVNDVAVCVSKFALERNDVQLFLRLLEACDLRIITMLGVEELLAAYRTFTWEDIQSKFTQAVTSDRSTGCRAKLVFALADVSSELDDTAVMSWCKLQNNTFIENMGEVNDGDIEYLIKSLQLLDNPIESLATKLLPKLYELQLSDSKLWIALFTRLQDTPFFDQAALHPVITDSIRHIASNIEPFQLGGKDWYVGASRHRYSVQHILDIVGLSIKYQVSEAIGVLSQRLWERSRRQDPSTSAQYYGDLVLKFSETATKHPDVQENMQYFFGHAFQTLLENSSDVAECNTKLQTALQYQSNPVGFFIQCLTPSEDTSRSDPRSGIRLSESMIKFIRDLRQQTTVIEDTERLQTALHLFLTQTIDNFDPTPLARDVLQGIDLCLMLGVMEEIPRIFNKCLHGPRGDEPDYIEQGLVTIATSLPGVLSKHGLSLSSGDIGAQARFVGEVAKKYFKHCQCEQFLVPVFTGKAARVRLPDSQTSRVELRHKEQLRVHFEDRLTSANTGDWGVIWRTVHQKKTGKKKPSHTLQIDLPDTLNILIRWFVKAAKGQQIMSLLGDMERQRQVLGDDSEPVLRALYHVNGTGTSKRPVEDDSGAGDGPSKKARVA